MMWIRLWWKKVGWVGERGRNEEELDFSSLQSLLFYQFSFKETEKDLEYQTARRIPALSDESQSTWGRQNGHSVWLKLIIQYCVLINSTTVTLKDFYILWTFHTTWRVVIHTTFSSFYMILAFDVLSSGSILKSRTSKTITQCFFVQIQFVWKSTIFCEALKWKDNFWGPKHRCRKHYNVFQRKRKMWKQINIVQNRTSEGPFWARYWKCGDISLSCHINP